MNCIFISTHNSPMSESDYDDTSFELRRLLLEDATERMVLVGASDDEISVKGYVGIKTPVTRPMHSKIVKQKNIIVVDPHRVTSSITILEAFRNFIASVGEKKCKKIMGMVNYLYRQSYELPYFNKKFIVCTRLELESTMRQTSISEYNNFLAELSMTKMRILVDNHSSKSRSFSEANITSLIYENYVGKYVCVNEGRSTSIWGFDDILWTEISHAEIWQEISVGFIDFLQSFSKPGDDDWDGLRDDITRYLSSVSSREHILRDLLHRLTNNAFQSKLNAKTYLIGMNNGIYDLEKGQLRDALPMDYVSMSTHINYVDEDEELRDELYDILRTIFPNKQVRKFFIQSCASLLEGRNREKYVYVWWGKGNNAKSMMEKLLACALGDYSTVAATSLVTGKRGNADAASPQLSALEGKLAVFLQEPNPNETIKIGMVKELSGGDTITARALFKGNRTFIPKFKLIIVCNTPVEIPNIDIAFTNRLIVIPFESTFRTKEDYRRRQKKDKLTKYDHLLDTSIARKIDKYAEIFFRILVEQFEIIGDEPLHIPKKIRNATMKYIEENNFSLRFVKTQCIEEENSGTNVKSLHSELKRWMNEHHGGKKVPNIDIFREEIINCGYEVDAKSIVHGLTVDYE